MTKLVKFIRRTVTKRNFWPGGCVGEEAPAPPGLEFPRRPAGRQARACSPGTVSTMSKDALVRTAEPAVLT